jgi:hypothetical protein
MEEKRVAVYLTEKEIRLLMHGLELWNDEPYDNFPSPGTNAGSALHTAMGLFNNNED